MILNRIFGRKKIEKNIDQPHYISFWTAGLNYESRGFNAMNCRMHEKVYLHREQNNSNDKNAIHVKTRKGKSLGYVGRYRAMKLAPLLDKKEVDNKAYIIDLKSDLIADVYGVKIAVPMDEKVFKKFTRKGINLDFIFEKSESGRQYLLLDCEEHRFDSILELLEKKKFHINRKGISYRPASNGKLYSWYILLDDNVETDKIQKHLIKKFPRLVEKLDQQLTEEYVNIQDKEISSLQEQNAVLAFENSKLYKQVQRYGKANKKMNEEFDKILSLVLEDVQFLRDSLDVLKNEIQDYSDPLKKLLQIRGDNELKATKINTLENWFELHFNTGQRDNGRIYFQRKSGKIHVLVTFKKEQKKDINYLKNY